MSLVLTDGAAPPSRGAGRPAPRRRDLHRHGAAWQTIVARLRAFAEARVTERRRRRTLRGLRLLNDHMLAEIGLARGEIELMLRSDPPFRS